MTDRRIQIIGTVLLPTSLVDAGKLQSFVAEQVGMLNAALAQGGVDGVVECKIVNTRPRAENRARPLPTELQAGVAAEQPVEPGPAQQESPAPAVTLSSSAAPIWARRPE